MKEIGAMHRITRRSLSLGILNLTLLFTSGGCLIAGTSNQTRTGKFVPESTFSHIEAGKTTAGWVVATLGEPTKRTKIEDGSEILEWRYSEEKETNGAVFLLFANSNTKKTDGAAFVEIKDGVVAKKWR